MMLQLNPLGSAGGVYPGHESVMQVWGEEEEAITPVMQMLVLAVGSVTEVEVALPGRVAISAPSRRTWIPV